MQKLAKEKVGSPNIRLLIFDAGGVIFEGSGGYLRYLRNNVIKDKGVLARIEPIYYKAESGACTFKQEIAEMSIVSGLSQSRFQWDSKDKTSGDISEDNKKVVSLIRALREQGYKVVMLSNNVRPRYYGLVSAGIINPNDFDRVFLSPNIKRLKPDISAYEYVLHRMRAKLKEAVFIDDVEANVDASKKVGIEGILFKTYKQLIKDLRRIGVRDTV